MAPEQWMGLDAINTSTDIYAFGVVLFELFAGSACWPWEQGCITDEDWYEVHHFGTVRSLSLPGCVLSRLGSRERMGWVGTTMELSNSERLTLELLEEVDGLIAACLVRDCTERPTARQLDTVLAKLLTRAGPALRR